MRFLVRKKKKEKKEHLSISTFNCLTNSRRKESLIYRRCKRKRQRAMCVRLKDFKTVNDSCRAINGQVSSAIKFVKA